MKFRAEEAVFIGLFIFFSLTILFPEASIAGTGGEELKTLHDKIVEVAQGYGGKSIVAVSFILGIIQAIRGQFMAVGASFGVGVVAGVGPSMVTSGISAII
jgi:hypothetical protein